MRRIGWWLIAAGWLVGGIHLVRAQDIGPRPSNTIAAAQNSSAMFSCGSSKLLPGIVGLIFGRHAQTIVACDEVLRGDPENLRAYALRGYAHLLQKHGSRQAIADFSEVLRRDPENVALRIARARAYNQEKDYDHAIADCDEAIHIDSHCALAHAWRGTFYKQKQVIGKPLAEYTMALRLDPQLKGTRYMRAEVFRRQGEIAKALDDLEEILRSDPHYKEALFKRCLISLEDLHDYDRVIEETTRLHRSEPRELAWYAIRNEAYLLKGEGGKFVLNLTMASVLYPGRVKFSFSSGPLPDGDEERINACTKRLGDDPKNVAVRYERACAYHRKGQNKQAAADMDAIIGLDPADAVAYRLRGLIRCDLRDYAAAIVDCNKAMKLDSNNVENYGIRGRAYCGQKKYDEARLDFQAVVRIDPRYKAAHSYLGWIHAQRGEREKSIKEYSNAITEYQKVLELNPGDQYGRSSLAWYLATCPDAKLRNGKEALAHATLACQWTDWGKPNDLDTLAAAYAECGDFEQAKKWQSRAIELAQAKDKVEFSKHLERYCAHQAYHISFSKSDTSSEK